MLRSRLSAAVITAAALSLPGCPSFDGVEFLCRRNSDCAAPQACTTAGRCCLELTCETAGGACGVQPDGCGGTIDCGCPGGLTCAGGAERARCQCSPRSCSELSPACGELDDGCGGKLDCACDLPLTCGAVVPGQCGCVPWTCAPDQCGSVDDRCGETVTCGECDAPMQCGAVTPNRCDLPTACRPPSIECGYVLDGAEPVFCGDCAGGALCGMVAPNRCTRPPPCEAAGATCGLLADSSTTTWCGSCDRNQACDNNRCGPSTNPVCWSDPVPLNAHSSEQGMLVPEDPPALYAATTRYQDTDNGCRRIIRLGLKNHGEVDPSRVERLARLELDHLDRAGCRRAPTTTCDGFLEFPKVRADGLELFFSASYPCADWEDGEFYGAFRLDLHAPWSVPRLLGTLTTFEADFDDGAYNPLLLEDNRTMVYVERNGTRAATQRNLIVARRPTTTPGDLRFQRMEVIEIESETTTDGERVALVLIATLSCDRRYLIYKREVVIPENNVRVDVRQLEIHWPGPTFGPSQPYPGLPSGNHRAGTSFRAITVSPDCQALYITTLRDGPTVRRRVPCQ